MYCSPTDILKRIDEPLLLRLLDDENVNPVSLATASETVTARLADVIEAAESKADAYLRQQYELPLPEPVPTSLLEVVADIAIHGLYTRRSNKLPDERAANYKVALEFLKDVAAGKLQIGAGKDKPEQVRPEGTTFSGGTQMFNNGSLGNF